MKSLRFAIAAVLGAAVLSGTASAYVLDSDGHGHSLRWHRSVVRYRMVAGNVPGGAAGENAVHAAFAAWSNASAQISYQFDGFSGAGAQAFDNRNNVYWIYSGWPYDPSLLGITFRFYDTSNGSLLDADIVFNGQRYSWSVGGGGYDVQNSATHEVGHFSGLGHSSQSEATMFASARSGETKKRDLHSDDVAGLAALYGGAAPSGGGGVVSAPGVSSGGGGGGGCSIGGMTSARAGFGDLAWTLFLLGGLALRRLRARGEDRCFATGALPAFAGAHPRGLSGASRRGSRLQHERGHREALFGARRHDRVLGSGV